jgi:hypothetical protein
MDTSVETLNRGCPVAINGKKNKMNKMKRKTALTKKVLLQ